MTTKYNNHTVKAKIIGLGEATHGATKMEKYRNDLFKYLIKNCDFTVLIIEDQILK